MRERERQGKRKLKKKKKKKRKVTVQIRFVNRDSLVSQTLNLALPLQLDHDYPSSSMKYVTPSQCSLFGRTDA